MVQRAKQVHSSMWQFETIAELTFSIQYRVLLAVMLICIV